MNEALETQRLRMRPFEMADAEAWHAIWGDPEVIWWGANKSIEESSSRLERLLANEASWPHGIGWLAVTPRDSDEILGDILLQPAPFVEGIEIGWHFRSHAWGNGYATEAARAVMERAFRDGVLDQVYALVATRNEPSLRLVERLEMAKVREMEYADLPHVLFALRADGTTPHTAGTD